MPGPPYRLYARHGAGSLAPQMLLEEIGAPYELLWVSKAPADIEAFRRISPAAKIPVLILPDGTLVSESAAILIHLANAHPAAALVPPGPGSSAHARFLQWMIFLSANVYEALLRFFYADRYSADGAAAAEQIKKQALSGLEPAPGDHPRRIISLRARRAAFRCRSLPLHAGWLVPAGRFDADFPTAKAHRTR